MMKGLKMLHELGHIGKEIELKRDTTDLVNERWSPNSLRS